MRAKISLLVLLLSVMMLLAACGGDETSTSVYMDDDADDDVTDDDVTDDDVTDDDVVDDDTADDDAGDDDTFTGTTAWDDMRLAEAEVASANFSTAVVYYRDALAKLEDDDPANDGPVEASDANRCRYAHALMLFTIPLAIADAFIGDLLDAEEIETMMCEALGVDDPEDLPTDLITVYLIEIIIPEIDRAIGWLDKARADADWSYQLPQIKIMMFGHAFRLPLELSDDLGEHDLGEANLLGFIFHLARAICRSLASNNIDTGAPNIDAWLNLFSSGDFSVLLDLIDEFPDFLTVHDPSSPVGIDGPALLDGAKDDFALALAAINDDNDGDGNYWLDNNGTPLNPNDDFIDPAEVGDDLLDALRLETDDQADDLIRWVDGWLSFNVEMDGEPVSGFLVDLVVNLVMQLATSDSLTGDLNRSLAGSFPPEENDHDGYDNDAALGVSTALTATTLTDAGASWTPGDMAGLVLNPNVDQAEQYDVLRLFLILDNTATTITVEGDMTEIAAAGETYSVGDGVADDRPLDLSLLMDLLIYPYVPSDAEVDLYLAAWFDNAPGLRYLLPLWDEDLGNPNFYTFVVDETEDYIDNNGNNRWDPGIDTLIDAAHAFGGQNYPADGAYQPFFFYFPEATFAGTLSFEGGLGGTDPTNALNSIISGLFVLLGMGG